jgi:hypothetical protein
MSGEPLFTSWSTSVAATGPSTSWRALSARYIGFIPLFGLHGGNSVSRLSVHVTMPSFWAQSALTMQSN